MPTDAEIQKVQANLTNLQAFNDYLYVHGNPLIANAYALLDQTNSDQGLGVCVNMMESAFWAMAAVEGGPAGAVGANTLCGVLNLWTSGSPPPDMGNTFSDLISRFEAASVDVDRQLATYHSDPTTYWDTALTYNGQTCTVGDLAGIDFPTESDPEFFTLMDPCLTALDQFIWKYIITTSGAYVIAKWEPDSIMSESFNFASWGDSFYGAHPSYWATCVYHPDSGECGDSNCYYLTEYNLSTGAGQYHDGHISDSACNYLFADRAPGHSYSECTKGLFPRDDVFTEWGLKVQTIYLPYGGSRATQKLNGKGWFGYLRAKKMGRPVLSDLQADIGMDGIKSLILDAVKADPTLRIDLRHSPHETMERILGVAVPKFMSFTFIAEGPRRFGLVIPWDDE